MKTFHLEHGQLFRHHETVQATSESALRDELMRTRPEIFPVQIMELKILRTPELTLEPKYTDTWHKREGRDVPFVVGGGR